MDDSRDLTPNYQLAVPDCFARAYVLNHLHVLDGNVFFKVCRRMSRADLGGNEHNNKDGCVFGRTPLRRFRSLRFCRAYARFAACPAMSQNPHPAFRRK